MELKQPVSDGWSDLLALWPTLLGECEFSASENLWIIAHTGVRPAFEGQGIARRLVESVIEAVRSKHVKIIPLCPYAKKMMAGKEEYKDVL